MNQRTEHHGHDLHFDTFHEYQVWKQARSRDIATGLAGCFSIVGMLVFLGILAWVAVSIAGL